MKCEIGFMPARGLKEQLENYTPKFMMYAYCTDTNELYIKRGKGCIPLDTYEKFSSVHVKHEHHAEFFSVDPPEDLLDWNLVHYIDTKEVWINTPEDGLRLILKG